MNDIARHKKKKDMEARLKAALGNATKGRAVDVKMHSVTECYLKVEFVGKSTKK